MAEVLISCPQEKGEILENLLKAQGFESCLMPVMTYGLVKNINWIQQQISLIKPEDHLIFISPQSVKSFFNLLENFDLNFDLNFKFNTQPIYAIGAGTAACIKNYFKNNLKKPIIYPTEIGQVNAAGLWDLIKNKIWAGQKVFIIRGQGGNDFLAEQLKNAGAQIVFLETYVRECVSECLEFDQALLWPASQGLNQNKNHNLKLVLLTSLEMTEYFFRILNQLKELKKLDSDFSFFIQSLVFTSVSEKNSAYLKTQGVQKILLLEHLGALEIANQVSKFLRKEDREKRKNHE